ncbi:MAG TPA: Spy/CpxP family protein refolding chaperone [Gemmatimonadaceae bacterium]
MKVHLTLAGVCLVLAVRPLVAQQPAPSGNRPMHPMAGMPMMDCPMMMSAMMPGPALALRSASALKLTPDQRTKLEAAKRQLDALGTPAMDSMRVFHTQLMALSQQPTLDEAAARAVFARMGRVHSDMGLAMLRASHDANQILTPVQRDSLAAITKRQMSGAMPMPGMPMHPAHPMHGAGAVPQR